MFYKLKCCYIYIFRLGCLVRNMLDRDEDMVFSGIRYLFYGKYKVMFYYLFVVEIIIIYVFCFCVLIFDDVSIINI